MSNIKGLESLIKKLNKLGGDVDDVLFNSMQKQGELVKSEAKLLCPIDNGDLRQSIKRKTKRYKGKIVAVIYTNQKYASYVEFGTGKVGEATNTNSDVPVQYKQDKWLVNIPNVGPRYIAGQPAQPYMYPALKNNSEVVAKNIKEDLKEAIRKVAKR